MCVRVSVLQLGKRTRKVENGVEAERGPCLARKVAGAGAGGWGVPPVWGTGHGEAQGHGCHRQ